MGSSASAAVFLDEMNDDSNFSSALNLSVSTGLGVAVFQPSATSVQAASIVWSNGGSDFVLGSNQVLSFMFSAYQAGTASSFTDLSFTAVYNNPLQTEILLGSDLLVQYILSGDTGNFAIPVVAEATGWSLRMDFDILTSSPSGTLGTADLDYLQVIPEPSSLLLVGICLPLFLRRRR
jgi:hypothetical protein